MSIFAGKTLMITGGTGSFGNAVLKRFLRTDIAEIRIFSRDEKKQDDMRHEYQAKYPDVAHKIKFYIGHHVAVALAVHGGHIVAQADVAPLERGVQPGQLVDDVIVEVEDAPVVLAQPLDAFLRDIAAAHQAFEDARRYPLGVLHVALLSRKLADEIRVHQLLLHIWIYHPPHRHPVHARALHPHLRHPVLHDDADHALQLRGQDTELFLKNNSFLIENTDEHTIYSYGFSK